MTALRELLSYVPQDLDHHPEGSCWSHTLMVRHSLVEAIDIIREAQTQSGSSLSALDFNLTKEEVDILRTAAWMHDVGKVSTTQFVTPTGVIPLGSPFLEGRTSGGRWQAIGHEKPANIKLVLFCIAGPLWTPIWKHSSFAAKRDWLFTITHHMRVKHWEGKHAGFGRRLSKRWVDPEGKYYPRRRVKLLMILILMDRLGRGIPNPRDTAWDAIASFESSAQQAKHRLNRPQSQPAPSDPIQFLTMLKGKGDAVVKLAFRGKFGREPTEQEMGVLT